MKDPVSIAAPKSMVEGESLPAWGNRVTKSHNTIATPSKTISLAGQASTLGWICEAHNCDGNEAHALFAPELRQAWALLISDGTKRQRLGKPDDAVKAAILGSLE